MFNSCQIFLKAAHKNIVVVGLGRTGKMWGVEHYDVIPDILVVGKNLSGGIAPCAGIAAKDEILGNTDGFLSGSTFAGTPAGCAAGIKTLDDVRIGDTITEARNPAPQPLPGFREVKPMVFSGLYPVDTEDYERLKAALEKLSLNDAAISFEPETSEALGFGFRCGFLGMLHMEIVQERLEREYDLDLITTAPTVVYEVVKSDGEVIKVDGGQYI